MPPISTGAPPPPIIGRIISGKVKLCLTTRMNYSEPPGTVRQSNYIYDAEEEHSLRSFVLPSRQRGKTLASPWKVTTSHRDRIAENMICIFNGVPDNRFTQRNDTANCRRYFYNLRHFLPAPDDFETKLTLITAITSSCTLYVRNELAKVV